ncbi:MAG: hypothetical protein ABIQ64_00140 [Candidatus Saccharimonadales bacterium]
MTAFQPDPEKLTAQEELGGLRPERTREGLVALGVLGLSIENPRLAARRDAHLYYETEFGITGHVTDRDLSDAAAILAIKQGLRDQTLPGMINDPYKINEPHETAQEAVAKLRKEAEDSWDEVEAIHLNGQLF